MKNDLQRVYSNLSDKDLKVLSRIINSNFEISWIPIIEYGKPSKRMGISQNGEWVLETNTGICVLNSNESFLFSIHLLEHPLLSIKSMLEKYFNTIEENFNFDEQFPACEIISFVLEHKNDDYWLDLALNWFDELSGICRKKFYKKIEDAIKRNISQKMRHRLLRVMNGIK